MNKAGENEFWRFLIKNRPELIENISRSIKNSDGIYLKHWSEFCQLAEKFFLTHYKPEIEREAKSCVWTNMGGFAQTGCGHEIYNIGWGYFKFCPHCGGETTEPPKGG